MTFEASADNETALHRRYAISYSCVSSSIRFHVIAGFSNITVTVGLSHFHVISDRAVCGCLVAQHGARTRGVDSINRDQPGPSVKGP
jgi:alpha-D-ribose 1-methylphosphonate 5-triphosphate synthase subunit PhnH